MLKALNYVVIWSRGHGRTADKHVTDKHAKVVPRWKLSKLRHEMLNPSVWGRLCVCFTEKLFFFFFFQIRLLGIIETKAGVGGDVFPNPFSWPNKFECAYNNLFNTHVISWRILLLHYWGVRDQDGTGCWVRRWLFRFSFVYSYYCLFGLWSWGPDFHIFFKINQTILLPQSLFILIHNFA